MKVARRHFCIGTLATASAAVLPVPAIAWTRPRALARQGVGEVWGMAFWAHDAGNQPPAPCRRAVSSSALLAHDPFACTDGLFEG